MWSADKISGSLNSERPNKIYTYYFLYDYHGKGINKLTCASRNLNFGQIIRFKFIIVVGGL